MRTSSVTRVTKTLTLLSGAVLVGSGCLAMVSSQGGGEAETPLEPRTHDPADVAVEPGYRIELVAKDLTYPAGVTFDDKGRPYVVETGYAYGEDFTTARLLRLEPGGKRTVIAQGKNGPWTGVEFHDGSFFIAEGGQLEGGRIVKVSPEGERTVLVEGLPSLGDHHTNGPLVHDGWVYFGQGTATNSAVVGPDNHMFGWLKRHPEFHDVPCKDVKLRGVNFVSDNPFKEGQEAKTGAYSPYGQATSAGQVIPGRVPCSGAIMRVPVGGGPVELVAWGFRNPFGLAFSPDGQLYATDNGYDDRGSRPVFGNADWLWKVTPGTWYGWPDYADGRPLTKERYTPPGEDNPDAVLAEIPNRPPKPIAYFAVHSSSNGIAFSTSPRFGHVGQAFVAQFGDQAPTVGKVLNPAGFRVVRVDVKRGLIHDFAANKGWPNGPASKLETGGLERPIDIQFDPKGESLYVVDFGRLIVEDDDVTKPKRRSGALWRIVPDRSRG